MAANANAREQAKPKRKWDCNDNFCRMKTVDVILSVSSLCDMWTEERAAFWQTESSVARKDAATFMASVQTMNAKITAFDSIIE